MTIFIASHLIPTGRWDITLGDHHHVVFLVFTDVLEPISYPCQELVCPRQVIHLPSDI